MKTTMQQNLKHLCALAAASLLITADATATEVEILPSSIPLCEEKTQLFLKTNYCEDPSVPKKFFTLEFGALWTKANEPNEDGVGYYNYDPILETQDMDPKFLGLGPGEIDGQTIKVPVGYQHEGDAPYKKIFVFEQRQGRWLIADILTDGIIHSDTGQRENMRSEFESLRKGLGE
jgi:hypothetical protein